MKKFLFFACLFIISCSGCSKQEKGCTPVEPQAEESQILAFTAANNITATKHSSGIYYQIIDPGSGATPSQNSAVSVNYVGKLLNGTTFDQSVNPVSFTLNAVIEGWQIGLPLVKKGGKIKLIIPSVYAYGCNGNTGIPPNSVLYFEINLLNVQ